MSNSISIPAGPLRNEASVNVSAALKKPRGVYVAGPDLKIPYEPLRPPAPPLLFDIRGIDLDATAVDLEGIKAINKHRGQAVQLDRLAWVGDNCEQAIPIRKVRDDEWWCAGHIPGRPIMPAVMMVEAAAQLTSWMFLARGIVTFPFVGFTRIENTKFRNRVEPGDTLAILCQQVKFQLKRMVCDAMGLVDGRIAFESRITGMPIL